MSFLESVRRLLSNTFGSGSVGIVAALHLNFMLLCHTLPQLWAHAVNVTVKVLRKKRTELFIAHKNASNYNLQGPMQPVRVHGIAIRHDIVTKKKL